MKATKIQVLTQAAMIAALYVILTAVSNALGLANFAIQLRFSEALTILPAFTPAAIPGLFIGCLIGNILTSCALPDILFGSLATLLGAFGTHFLCRIHHTGQNRLFLAPLPPILSNMLIIPFVLRYAYGIRPFWFPFLTVTAGELLSCGLLGTVLLLSLGKYKHLLFSPR